MNRQFNLQRTQARKEKCKDWLKKKKNSIFKFKNLLLLFQCYIVGIPLEIELSLWP